MMLFSRLAGRKRGTGRIPRDGSETHLARSWRKTLPPAVATEAIRKASNSAEFLQDVQRETGLQVHLIDGDVEAVLTFYGATYEQLKEPGAPAQLSVMDLGGGSMELVMAQNMHISWRTSIPIGSGWLHDRYLPSNPPTPDDLATAQTFLRTYLRGMRIKQHPAALIVTGGSANSLLLLAQQAFRLDTSAHRGCCTRRRRGSRLGWRKSFPSGSSFGRAPCCRGAQGRVSCDHPLPW